MWSQHSTFCSEPVVQAAGRKGFEKIDNEEERNQDTYQGRAGLRCPAGPQSCLGSVNGTETDTIHSLQITGVFVK